MMKKFEYNKSVFWLMLISLIMSCGIVEEDLQDFDTGGDFSGKSFYTEAILDSGRVWHNPDEALEIELLNVRTLSTCTLEEPQWINVESDPKGFVIDWNFSGTPRIDCPIGSVDLDTILTFYIGESFKVKDELILYGFDILASDTLPRDSLVDEFEAREQIPLDTLYLARGTRTLDSFYLATDSFRQVYKKVGGSNFGVVKAIFSDTIETLFYSEKLYTCPTISYEPCATKGWEWDTLDTRIPLDTAMGNTGPDTLQRIVSQFCANGQSLCDNAFRVDSQVIEGEVKNLSITKWHSFFYEETSECNEWNLWCLRHRNWLPSSNRSVLKRSANMTLYRERFDRIDGDRNCDVNKTKNLWLSLDSLRPINNIDTIKILDSILKVN